MINHLSNNIKIDKLKSQLNNLDDINEYDIEVETIKNNIDHENLIQQQILNEGKENDVKTKRKF